MKCDELKSFNCVESDVQEFCEPRLVYPKSEVDDAIAELKAKLAEKDKEIARQNEAWNRLCKKYNKFVSLKQEFCEKFKDIELEITK